MGLNDPGCLRSKIQSEFAGQSFDDAVTVCDDAKEACPFFPGASRQLHWSFEGSSSATGSDEERLDVFRRVRDQIAERTRSELLKPED